jgi:hypothetical protein
MVAVIAPKNEERANTLGSLARCHATSIAVRLFVELLQKYYNICVVEVS